VNRLDRIAAWIERQGWYQPLVSLYVFLWSWKMVELLWYAYKVLSNEPAG